MATRVLCWFFLAELVVLPLILLSELEGVSRTIAGVVLGATVGVLLGVWRESRRAAGRPPRRSAMPPMERLLVAERPIAISPKPARPVPSRFAAARAQAGHELRERGDLNGAAERYLGALALASADPATSATLGDELRGALAEITGSDELWRCVRGAAGVPAFLCRVGHAFLSAGSPARNSELIDELYDLLGNLRWPRVEIWLPRGIIDPRGEYPTRFQVAARRLAETYLGIASEHGLSPEAPPHACLRLWIESDRLRSAVRTVGPAGPELAVRIR